MRHSRDVLFTAALVFAVGIGVAWKTDTLVVRPWLMGVVLSLAFGWSLAKPRWRLALLVCHIACLGGLAAALQWQWWAGWAELLDSADYLEEVQATVWLGANGRWRARPAGKTWSGGPSSLQLVRGSLDPANCLTSAHIGKCVVVSGRPMLPQRAGNPGEFDPVLHALRTDMVANLQVSLMRLCHEGEAGPSSAAAYFSRVRETWREIIRRALPEEEAALVSAIVLGGSSLLPAHVREPLQRAGLAHITSVSGLHVGLVVEAACLLLGANSARWSWLAMMIASLFVLLTGAKPSSVRALVSAGMGVVGRLRGVTVDPWVAMAIAWLCLLVANPALLGDPGFVLSFSSVAGILILSRPLFLPKTANLTFWEAARRQVWNALALTLGAQMGTVPACAYYFNSLSLTAPASNLLGVPLATLALLGGLGACLIESVRLLLMSWGGVWSAVSSVWLVQAAGKSLFWVAGTAAGGLLQIGRRLGEQPWAAVEVTAPGWGTILSWVAFMICLSYVAQARRLPRVGRTLALRQASMWGLLALSAGALIVWLHMWPLGGRHLTVIFFDVGQGDAFLIQAPGGRAVLVDAGGRSWSWDASQILVPQLKRLGVRELTAVVSTHPHADHLGGMAGVIAERPVLWAWDTGHGVDTVTYADYQRELTQRNIEVRRARAGDVLHLGNVELQVLWPPADIEASHDANFNSIVLRVKYGQVYLLLTADAPVEVQQALLLGESPIEAVVWKVSHQGARSSFSPAFVEAVNPRVSVISVGPNNYGHPAPEVVDFLEGTGVVCRTDLHGAIRFVTNGKSWWIRGTHGSACRGSGRM